MYYVIVNPVAGRGRTLQVLEDVKRIFAEGESTVWKTESTEHVAVLARRALEQGDAQGIVCIGGDGTLSAIVKEMRGSTIPLYVVPCGTGNDFARAMGMPKDPIEALRVQLAGECTRIDVGAMNGRGFVNVGGMGLDVDVLRHTERFKARFGGIVPYLMGVAAAVGKFRPLEAELIIDGKPQRGKYTIISIANGQYIGGGMHVAREAQFADGAFDVILVRSLWRAVIPLLFPFFVNGLFAYLPVSKRCRARTVCVRSKQMTLQLDGELIGADEAVFEIQPGALSVARMEGAPL